MSLSNQPRYTQEIEFTPNTEARWAHALIARVINAAVDDALNAPKDRKSGRYIVGRLYQQSAVNWIFNPPAEPLFNSFDNFCDILDMDPARSRKKIYQMMVDKFGPEVEYFGINL